MYGTGAAGISTHESDGVGVVGAGETAGVTASSVAGIGVWATSENDYAGAFVGGLAGVSAGGHDGVQGYSHDSLGCGIYGSQSDGTWAGYFDGLCHIDGDLNVTGTITKGGISFFIDHPLDPQNQTLEHSCVESPHRKNVYDGVAIADASGEAVVQLPPYIEALNEQFCYQLTPLGAAAPSLHVKKQIAQSSFTIGGANPNQQISWQVTGIRKDAWAAAHPLVVERTKAADEKGFYLHPEAFGESRAKSVHVKRRPPPPARSHNRPPKPTPPPGQ